MCCVSIGCLVLPVCAGREGTAEVGVASLSVSLPPVTPRCEGGVEGREAAEREERRRRHQSTPSSAFLFLGRRDLLCADQWCAAAALSAGVVGAGAVFVVRALRQLVDGRQLVAMRVVVVVVVIQTFKKEMFHDSQTLD